jgi:hypothetical protein
MISFKEVVVVSIDIVRKKYEDQLMDLPNVVGVGEGKKAGKEVIMVLVSHKLPESSLRPQDVVPKMLEGYETDVEEIGVITAELQPKDSQ